MEKIFLTGMAGFIGYHTAKSLIAAGYEVMGFDNMNPYYDPKLKYDRLLDLGIDARNAEDGQIVYSASEGNKRYFVKGDLANISLLQNTIEAFSPDIVLHLAAQAGVRYSIQNPSAYIDSNIIGFFNILESCRKFGIGRLIYASSSSVYGNSEKVPFHESDNVDNPVSLYAATKKSNELLAHTYSHLFNISTIGLRFFTVYGPWGRPDMAPFLFSDAILNGKPIKVYNNGDLMRDFTYVSDIVNGIVAVVRHQAELGEYRIFNIGNSSPAPLGTFISLMEKHLGKSAVKEFLPMQPGDVYRTFADVSSLNAYCGYEPVVALDEGIAKFVSWYKEYFHLN